MDAIIGRLSLLLLKLSALVIAAAGFLIIYDVVGRALFGAPFGGTVELIRNAVVLITFMQIPYVIHHGALLRVTFVRNVVPGPMRRAMDVFGYLVGVVIFGALLFVNWEPTVQAYATNEVEGTEVFYMPMAPVRSLALILWTIALLACAAIAWRALRPARAPRTDEPSLGVG